MGEILLSGCILLFVSERSCLVTYFVVSNKSTLLKVTMFRLAFFLLLSASICYGQENSPICPNTVSGYGRGTAYRHKAVAFDGTLGDCQRKVQAKYPNADALTIWFGNECSAEFNVDGISEYGDAKFCYLPQN